MSRCSAELLPYASSHEVHPVALLLRPIALLLHPIALLLRPVALLLRPVALLLRSVALLFCSARYISGCMCLSVVGALSRPAPAPRPPAPLPLSQCTPICAPSCPVCAQLLVCLLLSLAQCQKLQAMCAGCLLSSLLYNYLHKSCSFSPTGICTLFPPYAMLHATPWCTSLLLDRSM